MNDLIEVTENLNAIPKGIYKFTGIFEGFICFRLAGRLVTLGVHQSALSSLRKVNKRNKRHTPLAKFLADYYHLLSEGKKGKAFKGPLTFCFLDPSLDAELGVH